MRWTTDPVASAAPSLTILRHMPTAIHTPDCPTSAFSSQCGLNLETRDLTFQAAGHAGDIALQPGEVTHRKRIDDLLEV
jgi:hypothetical protein